MVIAKGSARCAVELHCKHVTFYGVRFDEHVQRGAVAAPRSAQQNLFVPRRMQQCNTIDTIVDHNASLVCNIEPDRYIVKISQWVGLVCVGADKPFQRFFG